MTTGGTLNVRMVGHDGRQIPKPYVLKPVTDVDVPTEIGTLITNSAAIIDALQAVTDGGVNAGYLALEVGDVDAGNDGRLNRQAQIVVELATANKKGIVTIPAASDAIFVGDSPASDVVDLADTALVTYLESLMDFTLISDGEELADPLSTFGGKRIDKAFRPRAD